jgi:4-aminobutyrate aminotransferase-like enzyme
MRTIHLGIDLFAKVQTPLYAPLDGIVHSFANRDIALDYGPVIILQHTINNIDFFTLYGHLSQSSVNGLYPGKKFEKGSLLGHIGNYPSNGNWPPHLHFQIITDMLDYSGDYPGVCSKSRKKLWSSLCPDPNLVLNIEESVFSESLLSQTEIFNLREACLSSSLSLSYKEKLLITRGSGQYLYTDKGKEYLDGLNNVALVGHSHPRLAKIFSQQSKLLNTNTRYLSADIVLYSKSLLEKFPPPLNKCFIVNSGSEANDLALRLAFAYTKKTDIVVLDQGYHGHLISLIPLSTYKLKKAGLAPPAYVHVAPLPTEDFSLTLNKIEHFFASNPCAAFLCESAPSCAGQVILEERLLYEINKLARKFNVVMIIDEVQTGVGRLGTWWGFQSEMNKNRIHEDWCPDIITLGKGLGGGMALGGVVARKEIVEEFEKIGMEYFNTFGGGNLACRIGLEVLKIVEEEKLAEKAHFLGEVLIESLNNLKEKSELIFNVRGRGLFIGIELRNTSKEPAGKEAKWLVEYMKEEEKILLSTDGPDNNVIKFKPPLCWTINNCMDLVKGLERGLHILSSK